MRPGAGAEMGLETWRLGRTRKRMAVVLIPHYSTISHISYSFPLVPQLFLEGLPNAKPSSRKQRNKTVPSSSGVDSPEEHNPEKDS